MKKTLSKLLLLLAATSGSLRAQEAWVLEMPNKYSDYLIKKAVAGEVEIVNGIVEKIPSLITSKQIREIELISWKAEGGKIHPSRKITVGENEMLIGSAYRSSGGEGNERRNLNITAAANERNFSIDLFGNLSKTWTPTFAYRTETLTILVLERSPFDGIDAPALAFSRQLAFDASAKGSVTWYSPDSIDNQQLSYTESTVHPQNPQLSYGIKIFSVCRKGGETLLRIEAHNSNPAAKDILTLNHTEATFPGHSQTTGPLNKETIKIADKAFTKDGEEGTWTFTVTGE